MLWTTRLALGMLLVAPASGALARPRPVVERHAKAPARKRKPPRPQPPAEVPSAPILDVEAPEPAPAAPEAVAPAPAPEKPKEAAPVAVPEKSEAPPAEAPDRRKPDLRELRARYDELRDNVFRARARRETLEQSLLTTKMVAALRWEANRNYSLRKAELRLDGTRIWESGDKPVGDDAVVLSPRNVAPGPHVLAVRVDVRSRDNPKQGYVSEQSFSISLPEGKETRVTVTVDEDGDLPGYNPEIEIELDD